MFQITDLFLFNQYVIFNELCLFLRRETSYLKISLVFLQVILVFISCLKLLLTLLSFDSSLSLETRGVFLDASQALDMVYHDDLLFKLKQNGVSWNLLELVKRFPSDRVQRVTLNGKTSDWECIQAIVPQESIFGPLFS